MELKSIGKKIKNQRSVKNISQEKLAELIDATPSYISNVESGNRVVSLPTMLKIVQVLDLSLDYLLLKDMTSQSNDTNIEKMLVEFRNILEKLKDKQTIKEYIIYCRGIADAMIEIKENKEK